MNGLGVLFLGLIALSSLVQAVFLIRVAIEGKRFAARLDALQDRIERELRPALDQLQRVSKNIGEISDAAVLQARKVDALLADTIEKIEETTTTLQRVVLRPLGPLVDIAAFLKGIRRGLDVYKQLRGLDSPRRPLGRRSGEDDEHLFI
jgi:hypothetical protein